MDRDVETSGERKRRGEEDRPRGPAVPGERAPRTGDAGDADDREESGYGQPESSAQKAPPPGPGSRE